ncbi:MAG: hypothetical protein WBH67_05180 [Bacillota bacterium]
MNWADCDIYVGCVAVNVAGNQSILRSRQIKGLLAGLGGAAQYEKLLGRPGDATSLMDAQGLGHAMIIVLIVLGNISYILKKKNG